MLERTNSFENVVKLDRRLGVCTWRASVLANLNSSVTSQQSWAHFCQSNSRSTVRRLASFMAPQSIRAPHRTRDSFSTSLILLCRKPRRKFPQRAMTHSDCEDRADLSAFGQPIYRLLRQQWVDRRDNSERSPDSS